MPTLSVAAKILQALQARLLVVDGSETFWHDLTGPKRIQLRRPTYDIDQEGGEPTVFIARRFGTGDERIGDVDQINRIGIFDVIGLVPSDRDDAGLAAEKLLADLERAMERSDDLFLRDAASGRNLLAGELTIVDSAIDASFAESFFEICGFGIVCPWTHVYGDPAAIT